MNLLGIFRRKASAPQQKELVSEKPDSKLMRAALKRVVIPELRRRGFVGTFPHFRRTTGERLAIMSFQFDKWGGGFTINLAVAPATGFTTHAGSFIPPDKLNAYYDTGPKTRINAGSDGSTASWFRFDRPSRSPSQDIYDEAAHEVVPLLAKAEEWYAQNTVAT